MKFENMERSYSQILQQNREKDEHMFELGGKLYQYEAKMRQLEEEKHRQLEEMSNNFNIKYDEDYQEVNQKVELIEKEKDYFKEKLQEKEQELFRKIQDIRQR